LKTQAISTGTSQAVCFTDSGFSGCGGGGVVVSVVVGVVVVVVVVVD